MRYGLGIEEHDMEGRVIAAEFPEYFVVTCYTPNSQDGLARLDYRMEWENAFLAYLKKLEEEKPVIFCGDLNVAHKEIDLKNPKSNRKNAGFTDEERGKFTDLLGAGFIDTFRYFYPDREGIYSWWSYRFSARAKNAGWRIDYFCASESLKDRLVSADIHTEVIPRRLGSGPPFLRLSGVGERGCFRGAYGMFMAEAGCCVGILIHENGE